MRVGELTQGPHVLKAKNIQVALNKQKIQVILFTSKTHGIYTHPQKIKIMANVACLSQEMVAQRNFYPFQLSQREL